MVSNYNENANINFERLCVNQQLRGRSRLFTSATRASSRSAEYSAAAALAQLNISG